MAEGRKKAILLVDHGSVQAEANEALREIADLVSREAPEYHVEVAHMELEEPSIEQGFEACVAAGATEVIVHPYMLSPGRHATRDIPRMAAAAARRHPNVRFRVTAPLGVDSRLARIVIDRAAEDASEPEDRGTTP